MGIVQHEKIPIPKMLPYDESLINKKHGYIKIYNSRKRR